MVTIIAVVVVALALVLFFGRAIVVKAFKRDYWLL